MSYIARHFLVVEENVEGGGSTGRPPIVVVGQGVWISWLVDNDAMVLGIDCRHGYTSGGEVPSDEVSGL